MKKLLSIMLALVMVFALVACGGDKKETASGTGEKNTATEAGDKEKADAGETKADGEPIEIRLITMDQMDVHWVKLEAAAKAKVEELVSGGQPINYKWLAPEKKDNAQQIQMIETAINDGADVIIIACNDATAANDTLQSALDAGIKLIYIDSPSTIEASATFATDNFAAGEMAGKELLKSLEAAGVKEGQVAVISAQAGVQSCIDRVDGFTKAMEGSPYTLSEVQYSDGDAVKAQEQTAALINDGAIAAFGANDGASNGMGNAIREANASGKNIIGVGFDNSTSNRALIRDGGLVAFMAQNPNVMGEKSIETAVALMKGETPAEKLVDTGVSVVTRENVADFED